METQQTNNESGNPVPRPEGVKNTVEEPKVESAAPPEAAPNTAPSSDISEYKTLAVVGYIFPFLFFLPLLNEKTKNVPYVRFHANQQLILLICWFGLMFLSSFLYSMFFAMGEFLLQLINMALFALAIYGAWYAYSGEMKELPFIGQFKILK